jgi:hypothetical protein
MSKKRHEKAIKVLFLVLAQKIEAWWDWIIYKKNKRIIFMI